MEPDEMTKVRREIAEKLISKMYSFRKKEDFVAWIKSMTQAKFKALFVQCLGDIASDGDAKNTDALEIKTSLEG